MKKKITIIFIVCIICLAVSVSESHAWGFGYVCVKVDDRYNNPISWAYVAVDNATCRAIGDGYYITITSIGWHLVYVLGVQRWIYVGEDYTWVYFYL